MGSGHLHHLAHDRSLGVLRIPGTVDTTDITQTVGQGFTVDDSGGPIVVTVEPQINVKAMTVIAGDGATIANLDPDTKSFEVSGTGVAGFEIIVWTTAAMGSGVPV